MMHIVPMHILLLNAISKNLLSFKQRSFLSTVIFCDAGYHKSEYADESYRIIVSTNVRPGDSYFDNIML